MPSQETVEEVALEEVLSALRDGGMDSENTRELVIRWTEQQERRAEADPTNKRLPVELNIKRSELYRAAGDRDGAADCLYDAMEQAQGEGLTDLFEEARLKLAQL